MARGVLYVVECPAPAPGISDMILALHSSSFPNLKPERVLEQSSRLGFEGVVLSGEHTLRIKSTEEFVRKADKLRSPIYAIEAPILDLASENGRKRERAARELVWFIELASELSCGSVIVRPRFSARYISLRCFFRFIESLSSVEAECSKRGVLLLLRSRPRTFLNSARVLVRCIDCLKSIYVGAVYDQGSLYAAGAEQYSEAIKLLRPFMKVCYCRDARLLRNRVVWCAFGRGQIAWREVFSSLVRLHFSGVLTYLHPECRRRSTREVKREIKDSLRRLHHCLTSPSE